MASTQKIVAAMVLIPTAFLGATLGLWGALQGVPPDAGIADAPPPPPAILLAQHNPAAGETDGYQIATVGTAAEDLQKAINGPLPGTPAVGSVPAAPQVSAAPAVVSVPAVKVIVPVLVPGAGWTGPTAQPKPIGKGAGADAQAIARWDVVPWQSIDKPLAVGALAFSINGMDRVEFSLNGGSWARVSSMSRNPITGVWEYCATLDPTKVADGLIEVRAVAYPSKGIPRVLDSLYLYAASNAGSNAGTVYISRDGSDANPGTAAQPFQTIAKGLAAAPDGGTVLITKAGTYGMDPQPANRQNSKWITLGIGDGLKRGDVTIAQPTRDIVRPRVDRLKFAGLAFDFNYITQVYPETGEWVWFDNCKWTNSAGWGAMYGGEPPIQPVRTRAYVAGSYTTNCVGDNLYNAFVDQSIVRACVASQISSDVFQNSSLVVNSSVELLDGPISVSHNDVLQYFGTVSNVIVYGVKATRINLSQDIYLDKANSSFTDMAFVNVMVDNVQDVPFSQLASQERNILLLNVSTPGQTWFFRTDFGFQGTNVAMINCVFAKIGNAVPAGVTIDSCHMTTGAPVGVNGTSGPVTIVTNADGTWSYGGAGAGALVGSGYVMRGFTREGVGGGPAQVTNRGAFPY